MELNNSSFPISILHPPSHLLLLQLSHHSHKASGKVERPPRPFSQCSIPIPILKPPPDPKLSPSRTHAHTHTQHTTTVTPIPPLSLHGVRRWPPKSCIFSIRGPKKQTRALAHSPTAPKKVTPARQGGYQQKETDSQASACVIARLVWPVVVVVVVVQHFGDVATSHFGLLCVSIYFFFFRQAPNLPTTSRMLGESHLAPDGWGRMRGVCMNVVMVLLQGARRRADVTPTYTPRSLPSPEVTFLGLRKGQA